MREKQKDSLWVFFSLEFILIQLICMIMGKQWQKGTIANAISNLISLCEPFPCISRAGRCATMMAMMMMAISKNWRYGFDPRIVFEFRSVLLLHLDTCTTRIKSSSSGNMNSDNKASAAWLAEYKCFIISHKCRQMASLSD